MQKTKMIFTIGPASDSEEILRQLMEIGMNAARLNCSHGTHESHKEKIDLIKKLRTELEKPVAIVLDIKGPKIRTHKFENDEAELKTGDDFTFSCGEEILGNNKICSISYDKLARDIKVDDTILVDDGLMEFKVTSIDGLNVNTKVIVGGTIKNHKGVNIPNLKIDLPAITDKDKEDLAFGCNNDVDFVAASFIRKAEDVTEVRNFLDSHGGRDIKIISKIESQEGVDNVDSILEVTDGIMVARGDMGIEIPIEKVPIIQKKIIAKCNRAGKIVITATQMLDSMIRNARPTRAEACDICNAIFDGTDAVMLSGESASGIYPLEAARTMSRIALEAEENLDYEYMINKLREPSLEHYADAISYSAAKTTIKLPTKAIVAATETGATANLLSKYRTKTPIIAITPNEKVERQLSLNFGVIPRLCNQFHTTDQIVEEAKYVAKELNLASKNDTIIVAAGMPTRYTGGTNMFKIERID